MNYSLSIEIPGLPKTINAIGRSHWAMKAREAQYWKQCVITFTFNKKPSKPLQKARVKFTRFSSVAPDGDGIVSSFKHILDGLVAARILENDKLENIGMPTYEWEKAKQGAGKIRIEVFSV